jgi:hypothetical protein
MTSDDTHGMDLSSPVDRDEEQGRRQYERQHNSSTTWQRRPGGNEAGT